MQRRVFLESAAGLMLLSAHGLVRAAQARPDDREIVSSFAWATDVHHCRKAPDFWEEEGLAHHEYFGLALEKFHRVVDFMNARRPAFAVELGDFKDCTKTGTREETIALLDEVETEFRRFEGPRHHVAGNHDFDRITPADFLAHTENAGEGKGRSYYAFTDGGVQYIVLDGCFNSMAGEHYSEGRLRWDVSMVPDEELAWLRRELAAGSGPVVVFVHQLLNSWDSSRGRIAGKIPDGYFLKNASDVVALLEDSRRVLAVFSGHYHSGWHSERNGIHYIVGRGIVEGGEGTNAAGLVRIDRQGNLYIEGFADEPSRELSRI